jgi:hypothetical protein
MTRQRSLLATRSTLLLVAVLLVGGAALIAVVVALGNQSASRTIAAQQALATTTLEADAQNFAVAAASHSPATMYRYFDARSRSLASQGQLQAIQMKCTAIENPATITGVDAFASQGFVTVNERRGQLRFHTYWSFSDGAWHYSLGKSNPLELAAIEHPNSIVAPRAYCGR